MTHEQFIYNLCNSISVKSYLELGLYKGECIKKVSTIVPRCVGVDIMEVPHSSFLFYKCTTDEFFKQNKERFDFIFIDADHRYESAKQDLINALNILNYNGTIIMHDTDPNSLHLIDPGYCGDSYKINEWLDSRSDLTYITLPIEIAGLTIIKRVGESRFNEILSK